VEVFACNRTGDTILDTKSVRDSLLAAMQRSNPDSSPNSMQRKEIGGLFFQHVDSVNWRHKLLLQSSAVLRDSVGVRKRVERLLREQFGRYAGRGVSYSSASPGRHRVWMPTGQCAAGSGWPRHSADCRR
jgi:hypothetical protein